MAQKEEDVDKGEDGAEEGDEGDKDGEQRGGLLAVSPTGEEVSDGLLLKTGAEVKSMGQENLWCMSAKATQVKVPSNKPKRGKQVQTVR